MKAEMITNAYPLSPLQEGMLFHGMSTREPGVDLEQILCTLREEVNVPAFERAWLAFFGDDGQRLQEHLQVRLVFVREHTNPTSP